MTMLWFSQIPNGGSLANALAGFVDGTDRYCGRIFNSISKSTMPATVCSKTATNGNSLGPRNSGRG